jgi:hypothetical protein
LGPVSTTNAWLTPGSGGWLSEDEDEFSLVPPSARPGIITIGTAPEFLTRLPIRDQLIKGDHAGSDPKAGVGTRYSL